MVADVKTGDRFEAGASHLLFNFPIVLASGNVARYAPAADGQHFLFCAPLPSESAWMPIAVLGWARALRK
jgi:hypothetical protein